MSDEIHIESVRKQLFAKLIKEKVFWSYNMKDTTPSDISDEVLIALTYKYLDLQEIDLLKRVFSAKKLKDSWIKYLLPEGDYLYTLNRFLAWYCFDIKHPDSYLKAMTTRYHNKLINNA